MGIQTATGFRDDLADTPENQARYGVGGGTWNGTQTVDQPNAGISAPPGTDALPPGTANPTQPVDTATGSGETMGWDTLDPGTKALFRDQFGIDSAQAQWEAENAANQAHLRNRLPPGAAGALTPASTGVQQPAPAAAPAVTVTGGPQAPAGFAPGAAWDQSSKNPPPGAAPGRWGTDANNAPVWRPAPAAAPASPTTPAAPSFGSGVNDDGTITQFHSQAEVDGWIKQKTDRAAVEAQKTGWQQGHDDKVLAMDQASAAATQAYQQALIAGASEARAQQAAQAAVDADLKRQTLELQRMQQAQTNSLEQQRLDLQRRQMRAGGRRAAVRIG